MSLLVFALAPAKATKQAGIYKRTNERPAVPVYGNSETALVLRPDDLFAFQPHASRMGL
jgi:hypothetical protein